MLCIVACPPPENGTNTEAVPQSLNCSAIGTIYTYNCSDSYYLPADDLDTTCQSTGNWSLSPPKCLKSMYLAEIKMKATF